VHFSTEKAGTKKSSEIQRRARITRAAVRTERVYTAFVRTDRDADVTAS
jgi:hypothetical protein